MHHSQIRVNDHLNNGNSALLNRLDSLIFGYFQRMGYSKSIEMLSIESEYLAANDRKIRIGDQTVISFNDRIYDRTLEEIIGLYVQDGRFDVSREMLEFGEALRTLTNRYTTMTVQNNISRSDNHARLYGKSSISKHSQPVGLISGSYSYTPQRNSNFNTFTIQQSSQAKAQLEQQAIVQQAEERYRYQKINSSNQDQQHTVTGTSTEKEFYQNGNIEKEQPNHMENSNENVGIHSEGSSRRKLAQPQNLNTMVKETLIDPLVGIINEKPWDSMSDFQIDDQMLFSGLDVISKDFLTALDFEHENKNSELSVARPDDDHIMIDGFGINDSINQTIQIDGGMLAVGDEIEIEASSGNEGIKNDNLIEQNLQLKINRIEAPEPLISPVEGIAGIKKNDVGRIKDEIRKTERRSSSEQSTSFEDVKTKKEKTDRNDRNHKNQKNRNERSNRKSDRNDGRRSNRGSYSPDLSRRGSGGSGGSSARDRRNNGGYNEAARKRERGEMARNRSDRQETPTGSKRSRTDSRSPIRSGSRKNLKLSDEKNEKEKIKKSDRNIEQNREKVLISKEKEKPSSTPKSEMEKTFGRKAVVTTPQVKSGERSTMIIVDAKSKLMNKLRIQAKGVPTTIEEEKLDENDEKIKKCIDSSTSSSTEHEKKFIESKKPTIQYSIQPTPWKIPKKSSQHHPPYASPSSSSSTVNISNLPVPNSFPASSIQNLTTIRASSSPMRTPPTKTLMACRTPPTTTGQSINKGMDKQSKIENKAICDGEERENKLAFIKPQMSVIRLTTMLVNCDPIYENIQVELDKNKIEKKKEDETEALKKDKIKNKQSIKGDADSLPIISSSSSEESLIPSKEKTEEVKHVNTHPKTVQYAPQKVTTFAAKKNISSDDEDDEDEEDDEDLDEEDVEDDVGERQHDDNEDEEKNGEVRRIINKNDDYDSDNDRSKEEKAKKRKLPVIDMSRASNLLDKLHGK